MEKQSREKIPLRSLIDENYGSRSRTELFSYNYLVLSTIKKAATELFMKIREYRFSSSAVHFISARAERKITLDGGQNIIGKVFCSSAHSHWYRKHK